MSDDLTRAQRAGFPNMTTLHVIGVFDSDAAATAAERALEQAFPRDTLSVIASSSSAAPRIGAGETSARQGAFKGAAAGIVVGGLVAVSLAVPGIGTLLAAGPLLAVVSGSVVGGALGSVVGSLVGLGMTNAQAQEYEAMIRAGAIVVDVVVASQALANQATQILNDHGAHHVTSYQTHL